MGGKYFRKSGDEIVEALPSPNQSRTRACSFHGDTLVLTEAGLLPIRDVTTTMSVWSRDNATDRVGWQPVQAHYANDYDTTVTVEITDLSTGAQQDIISNRIHPFFVSSAQAARRASAQHSYSGEIADGHWVQAENLQPGDRLLNDDGTWSEVTSVTLAAEPLRAYNLTVNEFHTYFVAANTNAAPIWVHNSCPNGPEASDRAQLIDDVSAGGAKITPENVVDIRIVNGRTVWLETGNSSAGLRHIVGRHGPEFAQRGIPYAEIPNVLFTALQRNNVVGYQGRGTARPIYEFEYGGQMYRLAITVGDNGFIVGANFR
ncbi:MAG: polymorphic toxin-type HINT domain-containing protein [Paracoccus sp. (in: a-proteobacteria)]|nr:polymorphic toxin-type HINT domain-containing protein [Paracoccus sp. (in: a-proteobacteria)]